MSFLTASTISGNTIQPASMIQHNNPIHPRFDRLPRIIHVLNPLQHNRALLVIPEPQLVPRVRFAGEDVALPGQRRGVHVFIHGFMFRVVRQEDAAEYGVSETRVVADAFHEGRVGRVEVLGASLEGPSIEGHDEDGEVAFAGAGEKR